MPATDGRRYPVPQEELARFTELARKSGTISVLWHTRIAERMGLSVTDHKAFDLVRTAEGPLTAGRIAELTGLSTGAVTGVVDRLERAGFVRRVRDQEDRRKVLVEIGTVDPAEYAPLFEPAVEVIRRVLERFPAGERRIVERYQGDLLAELRSMVLGPPA